MISYIWWAYQLIFLRVTEFSVSIFQVKENYEVLEGRYEALNARVAALENAMTVETTTDEG